MKGLRGFLVLGLLISLAACATSSQGEQKATIIEGIPFLRQETYQCGPAALATVMNYWYGKTGNKTHVTPEQIASAIYSPTARGVLGLDLERYARAQGFRAEQYVGSMSDLRQKVDEGTPVIIFVDQGLSLCEINHFMVVTGYGAGRILVNSGKRENQALSERELERTWKKNHYWALALRP